MNTTTDYTTKVVNSALWSAYGDALGFITELRDNDRGMFARIGSDRVARTVGWKRRVGGKYGVEASLPPGCYSDDTQLRLATCRAIRPDSSFNIEAFAKMELPVWTSYALGAGRGTKAAATALARDGVNWFSNFYESDAANYFKSGGNGAAMRIQPHVWAARPEAGFREWINSVVRNAVTTHGHARGIVGAVFHAMCLDHARRSGTIPDRGSWRDICSQLSGVNEVIEADPDLKTFWLPVWEERSQTGLRDAFTSARNELAADIEQLRTLSLSRAKEDTYRTAILKIGAFDERERGSATKTALLATFLADLFAAEGPEGALLCAANCLQSDTDTIATMAGAIMGIVGSDAPLGELMDKEYIVSQAKRIARISLGEPTEQINYPNLLNWKPPKTQQDSVVMGEKGLEVLVLGKVVEEGRRFETAGTESSIWQWLQIESAQRILAKRRKKPFAMNRYHKVFIPAAVTKHNPIGDVQPPLPLESRSFPQSLTSQVQNVDVLTKQAIQAEFEPKMIGEHLLLLSSGSDGIERAVAYAAIIAKARLARSRHVR